MQIKTKTNLKIKELSKTEDICMLEKYGHGLLPLNIIKEYKNVQIGDNVTVFGAPSGIAIGEFHGKVMSPVYNGLGPLTIQKNIVTSTASMGGISGSPIILNKTREVIGVVVRGHKYFDHLTFGVNGYKLKEFIDSL